jgi:hypothetical protein
MPPRPSPRKLKQTLPFSSVLAEVAEKIASLAYCKN